MNKVSYHTCNCIPSRPRSTRLAWVREVVRNVLRKLMVIRASTTVRVTISSPSAPEPEPSCRSIAFSRYSPSMFCAPVRRAKGSMRPFPAPSWLTSTARSSGCKIDVPWTPEVEHKATIQRSWKHRETCFFMIQNFLPLLLLWTTIFQDLDTVG